jgi:hypothetical protein
MAEIIRNEMFWNEILEVCSININSIERTHAKITQGGDYEKKDI